MQRNKEPDPLNRWWHRAWRHLRKWRNRHGRTVQDQMIRGVASGVGSGAVSLLIIWVQTRY
ncbi:hypothetical protein GCM10010270_81260 [Streptomyces violaceus]|nr:hypothetical protein GCM10010270_81260 [Streptomyces janthinus]